MIRIRINIGMFKSSNKAEWLARRLSLLFKGSGSFVEVIDYSTGDRKTYHVGVSAQH